MKNNNTDYIVKNIDQAETYPYDHAVDQDR